MSLVFDALKRAGEEKKQNANSNALQSRNYYIFNEKSIEAKAPPVSGVYGLCNRRGHVLIGESANIREALLHHEKKLGFRLGLYRPIGFTFEVCPAELRAQRAEELTVECCPVLQRRFAFTRKNQAVSAGAATNGTQHQDWSDPTPANEKAKNKRFHFSAGPVVLLVFALAVAAVLIGFLGVLTERKIEQLSFLKLPVNPLLEGLGSEDLSSSDILTKRHQAQSVGGHPTETAKTQEKAVQRWAVQVKADRDKNSADVWVIMLKKRGYDSFVVTADIEGDTWYRVRVGPFDSRQEAETMRNILESQQGFRDAFVARTR